jgi:hypothetical protein
MPYFRLHCDNYLEGTYKTEKEAIKAFAEWIAEVFDPDFNVTVEEWNEKTGEWE